MSTERNDEDQSMTEDRRAETPGREHRRFAAGGASAKPEEPKPLTMWEVWL